MKKLLILALIFSIVSCTKNSQGIIGKTTDYLSTEKALKYDMKKLTIQGNDSDTLFIPQTTIAFFKSTENKDNLLGFKFIIEDSLIHPYFNIPMKNTYMFDGKLMKFESINPMQSETKISGNSEIEASRINSYISGHIPNLLELLKGDSYVNRIVKDTLWADLEHLLIKQADTTGVAYELFINKEGFTPSFLRIITNPTQPFIEEFNYSNFEHVDTTIVVQENYSKEATSEMKQITIGDIIPSLDLHYLTGENFSFAPHEKETTILCLSMINCGPCQIAVNDIKKMHLKYSTSSNIRFVVFYPIDKKNKLEKYVNAKDIDYPIVYNSKETLKDYSSVINSFKTSFPTFIILNDSNKIVWLHTGYNSKLIDKIDKACKKFCP